MSPAEITSIEACATELEDVAERLPKHEEAKADYDRLTEHVAGLRAMVERWKASI